MRQTRNHWNYETCMEESKKYKTRNEFNKGSRGAYKAALKNGWLDEYTWLEYGKKPNGYWTYETCMEESKKYTSRSEFEKGNASAYTIARGNGWLDEYTWLNLQHKSNGYWNYENCMEESKKYKTRTEFQKKCKRGYYVALKNGWLDEYNWLFLQCKPNGYWTYETCMEESYKYTTRTEFCKGNGSAYNVARKNGWLDDFFPLNNSVKMCA